MDLDTVTSAELILELAKRFDHMLVCGLSDTPKGSQDDQDFRVQFYGGLTCAIGMAERARSQMCRMAADNEIELAEDGNEIDD